MQFLFPQAIYHYLHACTFTTTISAACHHHHLGLYWDLLLGPPFTGTTYHGVTHTLHCHFLRCPLSTTYTPPPFTTILHTTTHCILSSSPTWVHLFYFLPPLPFTTYTSPHTALPTLLTHIHLRSHYYGFSSIWIYRFTTLLLSTLIPHFFTHHYIPIMDTVVPISTFQVPTFYLFTPAYLPQFIHTYITWLFFIQTGRTGPHYYLPTCVHLSYTCYISYMPVHTTTTTHHYRTFVLPTIWIEGLFPFHYIPDPTLCPSCHHLAITAPLHLLLTVASLTCSATSPFASADHFLFYLPWTPAPACRSDVSFSHRCSPHSDVVPAATGTNCFHVFWFAAFWVPTVHC